MQAIFLIFCQCLISGNRRGERKNFLQIKICKIGVKILFSAVIPEYFFITFAVQQIVRGDRNFSAASGKVNNEMGVRHSGTPHPQRFHDFYSLRQRSAEVFCTVNHVTCTLKQLLHSTANTDTILSDVTQTLCSRYGEIIKLLMNNLLKVLRFS